MTTNTIIVITHIGLLNLKEKKVNELSIKTNCNKCDEEIIKNVDDANFYCESCDRAKKGFR